MPEDTAHTQQTDTAPEEEKQCRICLDGEDPELGRLIRPCLCRGSVSYVHVKCLHRWRTTSSSQSAFFRCQQCGYNYRFARTQALGIASNPIVVGVLTAVAFTLLLFFSSFITTFLISGTSSYDSGSWFVIWPFDTFREVIRSAVCGLTDLCDDSLDFGRVSSKRPLRHPVPKGPSTLLGRFIRRLLLGLPTVGAGSMFGMLMNLPFPLTHWIRVRFRRSNRNSTDFTTLVLVAVVLVGAVKALMSVYRLTERTIKRVLLRAENIILEVS